MKFKNKNGYVEESTMPFLWCLLFGFLYFIYKGVWTHAVISFFLAIFTAGFSWFFYPFFASSIIENKYLKDGWKKLEKDNLHKDNGVMSYIALILFCIIGLFIYANFYAIEYYMG